MPAVPAVCNNCGTVFAMPNLVAGGSTGNITISNVKAGPCPNCGGMGSIPDGLYQFAGDTLRIFAAWPTDRLQHVATTLATAKAAADRNAVEQALGKEPDLAAILKKLSPLQDGPTFWAFISALLAAIMLLLAGQNDPNVTVNQETVIQRIVTQPTSTVPQAVSKRPPPPPRAKAKAKRSSHKAKRHKRRK